MAMREDLERLAEECNACALLDSASIDNHMITCPSCQDHRMKADEIESHVERLRDIADKDDLERRHLLGYDVNDFLNMSEERRASAMKDLFDNVAELDENRRVAVIRTRTDLLTSLPRKDRDAFIRTARTIYAGYNAQRKLMEQEAIDEVISDYGMLKRSMVRRMYRDMMT